MLIKTSRFLNVDVHSTGAKRPRNFRALDRSGSGSEEMGLKSRQKIWIRTLCWM